MCIYRDAHAYILAHIFMMFQMVFFWKHVKRMLYLREMVVGFGRGKGERTISRV
jgi:hypothetical protein